jgi:hypothetical protein
MPEHTIICGNGDHNGRGCGVATPTTRSNTKLCHVCRTLAELMFMERQSATTAIRSCVLCGARFARLTSHDRFCAACDDTRAWRPGTCELCGKQKPNLIADEVHVCLDCAKNPKLRTKLLQYLAGERGARRLDPEHHAQLDRWRRASVEAARDGRELPERPPTPVSGTAGATGASTPLTGGLPPMLSTDRGEDFEVEVVETRTSAGVG